MTKKEFKKIQQDMYLFGMKRAINVAVEYGNVDKIMIVMAGITRFIAIVDNNGQMAIDTWRFLGQGIKHEWKLVNANSFRTIKVLWQR